MKKILIISIFLFFFFGFFNQDAFAQLPEPWVEVTSCGPGQIDPGDIRNVAANPGKIVQVLEANGSCASSDIQITDFQTIAGNSITYCPSPLSAPVNDDGRYNRAKCCPASHPNSNITSGTLCCTSGSFPSGNNCVDVLDGSIRSGIPTVNTSADRDISSGDPVALGDGPYYECPEINCLLDAGGSIVSNNTDSVPLNIAGLNGRVCVPQGYENTADANLVCFQNDWLTREDYDAIVNITGSVSCFELQDETEKQRCLDCLELNQEGAQYYVYSSIGCVDTRQNSFVTRLFQIGLGLIGGFAIVRIMWGEVLRQSGKPEKIEEGREMEVAAIIAIALVVLAIPVLRFIGINVLQIFPVSIFN